MTYHCSSVGALGLSSEHKQNMFTGLVVEAVWEHKLFLRCQRRKKWKIIYLFLKKPVRISSKELQSWMVAWFLVHTLINNGYVRATYGVCVIMSVLERISTLPGLVFILWKDKGSQPLSLNPQIPLLILSIVRLLHLKLYSQFFYTNKKLSERVLKSREKCVITNVNSVNTWTVIVTTVQQYLFKQSSESCSHFCNFFKRCFFNNSASGYVVFCSAWVMTVIFFRRKVSPR